MERVDIAIVGGGPAGAAAARAAADRGASVVVLERGVPRVDRERLGPDSTDAAGILDYWTDIMAIDVGDIPEGIILQELDRAEFIGPTERMVVSSTGIPSDYPHFGFTYHRAKFDEWLRGRAERAGADYRVGVAVENTSTDRDGGTSHTLTLRDGTRLESDVLILADGPQRSVTIPTLSQFLPDRRVERTLGPAVANHIAYQEYRRFPAEVFDSTTLKFWWGHMPGHTAYPWVFPNQDRVARVGLTMPIDMDLDDVSEPGAYALLRPDDEHVPSGREYVRRLLSMAYGDRYDPADFPLLDGHGKRDGTETYPISSTRPIDSPVGANVAVTGGAMGATSAFHEGGAHLAIRTGAVAGALAARDELDRYNDVWKRAIGDEILRNVSMAAVVRAFEPADWDRVFRVGGRMDDPGWDISLMEHVSAVDWTGVKLAASYVWHAFRQRGGRYVQIREDEFDY